MDKIFLALATAAGLLEIIEIQYKQSAIEVIPKDPDMKLGYHTTVHDADSHHPQGTIHLRLNPARGVVRSYPGGEQVSDHRGMVFERTIPSFSEIRGVVSLYSNAPGQLALVAVEPVITQLRELAAKSVKKATVVAVKKPNDAFGFDILLVEPGNLSALGDWLLAAERLGRVKPDPTILSSVHVFSKYTPWLAVVLYAGKIK